MALESINSLPKFANFLIDMPMSKNIFVYLYDKLECLNKYARENPARCNLTISIFSRKR